MMGYTDTDASPPVDTSISRIIQTISDSLTRRDLDSLMLLFADLINISHTPSEKIQYGIQLFSSIEHLFPFGDFITVLTRCLNLIERNDLVLLLGGNPDLMNEDIGTKIPHISEYRMLLFNIAESLSANELKCLTSKEYDWLTTDRRQRIISAHSFLRYMEKGGQLSIDNFALLRQHLLELRRADLTKIIDAELPLYNNDDFSAESREKMKGSCDDNADQDSDTSPDSTINTQKSQPHSTLNTISTHATVNTSDSSAYGMEYSQNDARDCEAMDERVTDYVNRLKSIHIDEVVAASGDDMPSYNMTSTVSGLCVIINNEVFSKSSPLADRPGSATDVNNLAKAFHRLNFDIMMKNNLKTGEMTEYLKQISKRDHTYYDSFVCCILTHGKRGKVHGIDGKLEDVVKLASLFQPDNCLTLKGKPKMFFIQACRGDQTMGMTLEEDGPVPPTIPLGCDFLFGYPTVMGHVSYRDAQHGSWYIYTLTSMLNKCAPKHDLLSILTRVNFEISRGVAYTDYKQVPAPENTLRHKVMFKLRSVVGSQKSSVK